MLALTLLLILLAPVLFILYSCVENKIYKDELKNEKLISYFSWARMTLMKMVELGEIEADSIFFKYILSATSYSVRGLYLYPSKTKTLDNVNILKFTADYCLNPNLKEEFKNLNFQQKKMLIDTTSNVLQMYFDTHYIEKFIFKVFCKKIKNFTLSIPKRISKLIPEKSKTGLKYAIEVDQCLTCYAC